MKTLALCILVGLAMFSATGCGPTALENDWAATPVYSGRDRATLIGRSWSSDWRQMQDDIDMVLLLRPHSNMTIWHAR